MYNAWWHLYGRKNLHDAAMEAWSQCFTNANRMLLVQTIENFINACVFGTEESHS
jgi:hypothetical protein